MTMVKVVNSFLSCGCTGIQRGTRSWWWELELACGHTEERYVPSSKAKNETAVAPKKVKCGFCESIARKKAKEALNHV